MADAEKQKLLEQKKLSLLQEQNQLQQIQTTNQQFVDRQSIVQKDMYQASRDQVYSEQDGPLQIILAPCQDQSKSAINWNPYTQTSTLSEGFTKFGNLLIGAIPDQLPSYNSSTGGCINDNSFCVTVNITEVEYAFKDGSISEDC